MSDPDALLSVRDLRTSFHTDAGELRAVDGVSFDVDPGETVCLVGESGSGKTVAAESITRLVREPPGDISAGAIRFKGRDLTALPESELEAVRGSEIAYVFQNPQGALNPVYTVGWQVVEAIRLHEDVPRRVARERAVELLSRVGIPEAATRFEDYPHEFSGGMKQRVVIAMALASNPDLLVADEPTTALDVTIQAQILGLIQEVQAAFGMAVLLITHDLGVVAEVADRVVVLYAGKVMETGDVYDVLEAPSHPYTRALLSCLPGRGRAMRSIGGSLPDPTAPPPGCRFAPRCRFAVEACRVGDQPPLHPVPGAPDGSHAVSCVHYGPGGDPAVVRDGEDETPGERGEGVADDDGREADAGGRETGVGGSEADAGRRETGVGGSEADAGERDPDAGGDSG